jgi:hypothetical protein
MKIGQPAKVAENLRFSRAGHCKSYVDWVCEFDTGIIKYNYF